MKTKIIATIGPASSSPETLQKMIDEGVDVCRLNFSHGSYDDHSHVIKTVHDINKKKKTYIAVMADLQGPKLRIGKLREEPLKLHDGQTITITNKECLGDENLLYLNYELFAKEAKAGDSVLLDDGKIHMEVIRSDGRNEVKLKVVQGGKLMSRKGVNLPNTRISLPSLTKKDIEDLNFILENRVQWIALSFVRKAEDIRQLKDYIAKHPGTKKPLVIAKIEKPQALDDIDQIIQESDGIMVARGDLGIEVPIHRLPTLQKLLVKKCLKAAKPIIIATQMMEGMIQNITPTRAEVNDVANSVLDGADALMLSAETSVGKYPIKVVQTMQRIIREVEDYDDIYYRTQIPDPKNEERYISDSILINAVNVARQVKVKAIIAITHTGYAGFRISSLRPKNSIYVFTDNRKLLSTISLGWGLRGFYYDKYESTDDTIRDLKQRLLKMGLLNNNDLVINLASMPCNEKGKINTMKLSRLADETNWYNQ